MRLGKYITLVAAVDLNNGIGKDGELLYFIKKDLKRFKEITKGLS